MQCAIDATSLIRTFRVVDSSGEAIEGITFDDPYLSVSYKLQASGTWVTPTLVEGELGDFLANSWIEDSDGDGLYQWCPPNAVVVSGTVTDIRVIYGSNDPQYDTIEATLLPPATADTIDAIAVTLSGSPIRPVNRVSGGTVYAYIGDDYKVRSGTQVEIPVTDTGGVLHARLLAIGVENLNFGASREYKAVGEITGTIDSLDYASNVLTITVEITACASGLTEADFCYQIQSTQEHVVSGETQYDDCVEVAGTMVVSRRTVAPRG